MKKIDVVFPAYINASIGPTGTLRRLMANRDYLLSRGYELNVFTLDSISSSTLPSESPQPIDFSKGLGLRSKIKDICKSCRLLTVILLRLLAYKESQFIKSYLKKNRNPEVVVFHSAMPCHYYLKHRRANSKVVLFHHSNGLAADMIVKSYPTLKGGAYLKKFVRKYKFANNNVDQNVFISYEGYNNFKAENNVSNMDTMTVFHNGIDDMPILDVAKVTDKKYNLCTTGTVCERKGQYLILEAMARLDVSKRKDFHLSIYGNGPDLANLQQYAKEHGLEDSVSLYGYVPNKEIHEKLSANNIYVLMSNNEGLPISIIEAMRAGLGIISTRISGIPEQVDERNGVLIEPNSEQLYEILNNMDQLDWESLGVASRRRFDEEFTFKQMISSYCDMLDKVTKN